MNYSLPTQLLKNRNYSDLEIDHILYNRHLSIKNPAILPNAIEAARLLKQYCEDNKSEIHIFADYDVDGLTSGYIIKNILDKYAKGYVSITYPNRADGYGLSLDFCNKVIESKGKTKNKILVVTVDNGITCVDAVNLLKQHNIETLILDHHEAKEEVPDCLIVDPHGATKTPEQFYLCGCGVVFKVMQIFTAMYDDYEMMSYTPYLALGTLADSMELSEENIAFIRYGIEIMNAKEYDNIGLQSLLSYCDLDKANIYPGDLNFSIIPKLNACGRMGNIMLAYDLLTCKSKKEADNLINDIEVLNEERKNLRKSINFSDYKNRMSAYLFHDIFDERYAGVCGTIASSAIEELNVPVAIVMTSVDDNYLTGSMRTINENFSAQELLQHALDDGIIESFGGHICAAGFKLLKEKYTEFYEMLILDVFCICRQNAGAMLNKKSVFYDTEISLDDISSELYCSFADIPFKNDPVFLIRDAFCVSNKTSKNNTKNIEYTFSQNNKLKRIWVWGKDDYNINRNRVNLYCNIIKDFRRPSDATACILDIDK